MIGESPRDAATGRHEVDVGVAVVLSGECDLCAVWREMRVSLYTYAVCQPHSLTSFARQDTEVACEGEDDLRLAEGGLLRQERLFGFPLGCGKARDRRQQVHKREDKAVWF